MLKFAILGHFEHLCYFTENVIKSQGSLFHRVRVSFGAGKM